MRTVKFGTLDSYDDLGLVRAGVEIGAPAVKTETVDVPGMDGSLDLTEYFGEPLYEDRELTFTFHALDAGGGLQDVVSTLQNALHGRRTRIQLSEEPGFYYVGRVSVDAWRTDDRTGEIEVVATCEPYKYKATETVVEVAVDGTVTKTFANLRKTVVPTFSLSAAMKITQGTSTYSASAGTFTDTRIRFREGDNQLTFVGTGTATVTYQERGL